MALGCSVTILGWVGPPLLAGISLMVVVAALFYMLGNLFRKEDYIEISKAELYNIIVTLVLVFSFMGIITLANEISCSGPQGQAVFDVAISNMNRILYGEIYPVLRSLFQMMLDISALANLTLQKTSVTFAPLGSLKYLYTSLNIISYTLESMYASLYLQSMLLVMLKETALTIIMPVGIFLRTFPILREAGTFLMVLAFSLYTVYPYVYVFSLENYNMVQESMRFDEITQKFSHDGNPFFTGSQWVEDTTFWVFTFFNYDGIRDMFMKIGGHIFLGIIIPALATMLSIAMTQSIMRFIKEVTA